MGVVLIDSKEQIPVNALHCLIVIDVVPERTPGARVEDTFKLRGIEVTVRNIMHFTTEKMRDDTITLLRSKFYGWHIAIIRGWCVLDETDAQQCDIKSYYIERSCVLLNTLCNLLYYKRLYERAYGTKSNIEVDNYNSDEPVYTIINTNEPLDG